MPRKPTAAELQDEEAAASSPLRRSNRIVNTNGTAPTGIVTRRTSQTNVSQADIPARATRGRRASAQDSEDKVETKPAVRTRRASILADEESQKEKESTPSRRNRKHSVTSETSEKESEKPKPVRGRRTSTAAKNDEQEEEKPNKTAAVRSRRSSSNAEPETIIKVAPKTPARTTTRRRSSTTENAAVEEVATPAKRTTRGRRASNASETSEEVKQPTSRGRRKSVNSEDDVNEKPVKPAPRGRKSSTDDVAAISTPKTPGRSTRRTSTIKEAHTEPSSQEKDSSHIQKNDAGSTEEDMSPIVIHDLSVKVTPLKKRKVLEQMEAQLDLSIINESADDFDSNRSNASLEEKIEEVANEIEENKQIQSDNNVSIQSSTDNTKDVDLGHSPDSTSPKQDSLVTSTMNKSFKSAEETNEEPSELSRKSFNKSLASDTSPSKKRLAPENEFTPPRKSPRLTEKLSRNNTPKEEEGPYNKKPTPRKPRNIMKESDNEVKLNEKSQASFISSGSDGSFKFHLSNASITNSGQHDSNKENSQEDILNTSKESTGSNKENIELIDSSNSVLDISGIMPVQEPIVVSRMSNVFKPNQKEYSFMEPMEVVEDSVLDPDTSVTEKGIKVDNSAVILNQKVLEHVSEAQSEVSTNYVDEKSLNLDESSVVFNHNISNDITDNKEYVHSTRLSTNHVNDKSQYLDDSSVVFNPNISKEIRDEDVQSAEMSTNNVNEIKLNLDESSLAFSHRIANEITDKESIDISKEANPNHVQILEPSEVAVKENWTETKNGKETKVNIDSCKIETKKLEVQISDIAQRRSRSPASSDASLIINQPLEQVKVALLGKSSSPITDKQRSLPLRKSRSPTVKDTDGTDNKYEEENMLRVIKPARKSKSVSPSRDFKSENKSAEKPLVVKRSKSNSTSSSSKRRLSNIEKDDIEENHLSVIRRSMSKSPDSMTQKSNTEPESPSRRSLAKSPSFIVSGLIVPDRSKSRSPNRNSTRSPSFVHLDVSDKVKSRKSTSPSSRDAEKLEEKTRIRSKSRSPLPDFEDTPVIHNVEKLTPRKLIRSTSDFQKTSEEHDDQKFTAENPLTDFQVTPTLHHSENITPRRSTNSQETPITHIEKKLPSTKTIMPKSKSSLLDCSGTLITGDDEQLEKQSVRCISKSPSPEISVMKQSFQNCKESEEIIVIKAKKSIEAKIDDISVQDTSMKNLSDVKTTEDQLQLSELNQTAAEHLQDKTEYHTAIATTNNESDFNSFMNSENDLAHSHIKDSESTHYDFDLDSDDDSVKSRNNSRMFEIENNLHDTQTPVLQKPVQGQRESASEQKKLNRNSVSPMKERKKVNVLTEDVKLTELTEIKMPQCGSSEQSPGIKDDVAEYKDNSLQNCISKAQESFTDLSQSDDEDSLRGEVMDRSKSNLKKIPQDVNLDKSEKMYDVSVTVADSDDKRITDQNFPANIQKIRPQDYPENTDATSCFNENPMDISADTYEFMENSEDAKNQKAECMVTRVDTTSKINTSIEERRSKEYTNEEKVSTQNSPNLSNDKHGDKKSESKRIHQVKKNFEKDQNEQKPETVDDVSTCKMAAKKVGKTGKSKPSLDEFASSKLDEYLNSVANKLEQSDSEEEVDEEEESEGEYNEFIDGMAEEGEEDTPSEDSNQIIDEGESVGSSSEDISEDDYDENDSFICDDEDQSELLSGDEYDLGNEKKNKKPKKSRIIDPTTLGNEDIIKIPGKKKVEIVKPKKRSRIITVSDSSEEEKELNDSVFELANKSDAGKTTKNQGCDGSVILIDESKNEDNSNFNIIERSEIMEANKPIITEESKYENTTEDSSNPILFDKDIDKSVFIVESSKSILIDKDTDKSVVTEVAEIEDSSKPVLNEMGTETSIVTEESNNESVLHNASLHNLNTSIQKRHRKSSLSIQENILLDGVKDPMITKRINTLVQSFCSTVKKGEIALNLSLEYEDSQNNLNEKDKIEAVHILSDIKVGPRQSLVMQEQEVENMQEDAEENELLSISLNDVNVKELTNRRNLKRRLSKSVDEIYDEVEKAKRRKIQKKQKERVIKPIITKNKKKNKTKVFSAEHLRSALSSFGIMNQLITDVKNRPKRVMKPTKTDMEAGSSWITTTVTNLKPSTTPVTKQEKIRTQPQLQPKFHPKDFKNQMLSDNKKIKRVDTKTLLKKKGAFY